MSRQRTARRRAATRRSFGDVADVVALGHPEEAKRKQAIPLPVVLAVVVVAIGASGPMSRAKPLLQISGLAVASWRMALSATAFGLASLLGRSVEAGSRMASVAATGQDRMLTVIAGVAIAAHFAFFYTALRHTTIVRATLLVSLVPLFAGLLEAFDFPGSPGSSPPRRFWLGIAVALVGATLAIGESHDAFSVAGQLGTLNVGDILALAAAAVYALYMRLGSVVRQRVDLKQYQLQVTSIAATVLIPVTVLQHGSLLVGPSAWPWLLAATLIPQLLGQAGLDHALKYMRVGVVGLVPLLEPVAAIFISWCFLGEIVTKTMMLGSATVIGGVMLAMSRP